MCESGRSLDHREYPPTPPLGRIVCCVGTLGALAAFVRAAARDGRQTGGMRVTLTLSLLVVAAVATVALVRSGHAEESAMPELDVMSLEWMAGHWAHVGDDGRFDEVWLPPAAGALQAVSRQAGADGTSMVELSAIEATDAGVQLRIRHFDSRLTPWKSEADGPGTWTLVSVDGESVVFEDAARDFPRTIGYARERVVDGPDVLVARLRGEGGPPGGLTFRLVRVE